jgi:hypothetical protein
MQMYSRGRLPFGKNRKHPRMTPGMYAGPDIGDLPVPIPPEALISQSTSLRAPNRTSSLGSVHDIRMLVHSRSAGSDTDFNDRDEPSPPPPRAGSSDVELTTLRGGKAKRSKSGKSKKKDKDGKPKKKSSSTSSAHDSLSARLDPDGPGVSSTINPSFEIDHSGSLVLATPAAAPTTPAKESLSMGASTSPSPSQERSGDSVNSSYTPPGPPRAPAPSPPSYPSNGNQTYMASTALQVTPLPTPPPAPVANDGNGSSIDNGHDGMPVAAKLSNNNGWPNGLAESGAPKPPIATHKHPAAAANAMHGTGRAPVVTPAPLDDLPVATQLTEGTASEATANNARLADLSPSRGGQGFGLSLPAPPAAFLADAMAQAPEPSRTPRTLARSVTPSRSSEATTAPDESIPSLAPPLQDRAASAGSGPVAEGRNCNDSDAPSPVMAAPAATWRENRGGEDSQEDDGGGEDDSEDNGQVGERRRWSRAHPPLKPPPTESLKVIGIL